MKTHYGSTTFEEEDETGICGIYSENISNNWGFVSCKKCQKRKEQHKQEMKIHMEHQLKDMEGYVNFINKQNKTNNK